MKRTLAVALAFIFVLAATSVTFAAEKQAAPAEMKIRGNITAVDANAMTITVKGKKGIVTVVVDDKTEFKLGKDKKAMSDLKVGDKVKIFYLEADGKNTAKSIEEHPKK
jgi:Cu/Ag efflux protein CusF